MLNLHLHSLHDCDCKDRSRENNLDFMYTSTSPTFFHMMISKFSELSFCTNRFFFLSSPSRQVNLSKIQPECYIFNVLFYFWTQSRRIRQRFSLLRRNISVKFKPLKGRTRSFVSSFNSGDYNRDYIRIKSINFPAPLRQSKENLKL